MQKYGVGEESAREFVELENNLNLRGVRIIIAKGAPGPRRYVELERMLHMSY